ncbi:ParB/RepB/Spo0J family partition protein [Christensenellaceae bacterium OttesenSCG-928-K19]|nr:ParB/RepB/Spo0J family partition protein [Christensenellaceae bacterium OttesenSCG-928-K19]
MKRGLGKGLDALMKEQTSAAQKDNVTEIDILLLDNNQGQPRKKFDEEKLNELAQSIAVHGIMQPVIVYEKDGRYTIVAGERRFRAAKIAGLKQIPVLVKDYSDQEILELSLIENIQREDLNPMEQAAALQQLVDDYGLKQEEVAKRVGKSRSAIANLMRLQGLPDSVKDMVREGRLSAGHARCLLPLENNGKIEGAAALVCQRELSVRQAEQMVKDMLAPKAKKAKEKKNVPVEIKDAQSQLSEALETKVKIHGSMDRGHISIDYYNKEQLEGLFDFLKNRN